MGEPMFFVGKRPDKDSFLFDTYMAPSEKHAYEFRDSFVKKSTSVSDLKQIKLPWHEIFGRIAIDAIDGATWLSDGVKDYYAIGRPRAVLLYSSETNLFPEVGELFPTARKAVGVTA